MTTSSLSRTVRHTITGGAALSEAPYHHGDLRRALLEAALTELSETGLEAFSLRKVARRAGVSHAAPAHHFDDVKGLLTALAAEGYRRFVDAMQVRQDRTTGNARDVVLAAGLGYVDFACKETALFRLIHASDKPDYADPELERESERAYFHISALVSDLTGYSMGSEDLMNKVAAIWAQTHGLADLASNNRLKTLSLLKGHQRDQAFLKILSQVSLASE